MIGRYAEFEKCVVEIFSKFGLTPSYIQQQQDSGFDFVLTLNEADQYAVEVKFYRTAQPKSQLIKTSAKILLNSAKNQGISKAILVVSSSLPPDLNAEIEKKYQVSIVGRDDLLKLVPKHPELQDRLRSIIEENTQVEAEQSTTSVVDRIEESGSDTRLVERVDTPTQGRDLCSELREISKGKSAWIEYEKKCEEILKYLFFNELDGWRRQEKTEDGLNRFDLICRAKDDVSKFWTFIAKDLGSRYVVFEFKNYTGPIKQGQVLTTEKYLLKRALRSVAFILSRKGADNNALHSTYGAMRETGKLMVILDDSDLCEMLTREDQGDDPSDYLFEKIDDFLMRIPR